jgi:hypothetical protein
MLKAIVRANITGKKVNRSLTKLFKEVIMQNEEPKKVEMPAPAGPLPIKIEGPVRFGRPEALDPAQDAAVAFYAAIRNRCEAVSFNQYDKFISDVMCNKNDVIPKVKDNEKCNVQAPAVQELIKLKKENILDAPFHGVDAFNLLKLATEAFLLLECGVMIEDIEDGEVPGLELSRIAGSFNLTDVKEKIKEYLQPRGGLPYLERIVDALFPDYKGKNIELSPFCAGILKNRFTCPCLIELIWSYWHEEGMLAQTMNAVSLRFQNRRAFSGRDPLAHFEIDPLRPLNNLLWGYVQDEQQGHLLSVKRRAYEYDHHYGLRLYGKAVQDLRTADSRSKFIEAYHSLLHLCSIFYKEEANTMVIPDGFPILNALKEVNLIIAQGAHNQFGDLPWTARKEMLIQEWLLARPEMREFLGGRVMVPYQEKWMDRVDTMKKLQGWSDVSVTHFHDLASFGEQILLSIRYWKWSDVTNDVDAKNWANYWKPEIQGYIHAYRAATGVDLTAATASNKVDSTLPSEHLQRRLAMQSQPK